MAHFLSRRLAPVLFSAVLLAGCGGGGSGNGDDEMPPPAPNYQQSADDAYTYLLPLVEMSATRKAALDSLIQNPNVFLHVSTLADASSKAVTTPNTDTLYSSAFLLLADGPVQIDIPDSGDRYFSLSLLDFYTNNIAVRGTRVDGGAAKSFWVVGPQWSGTVPSGVEVIRSPTDSAWALGRTYVRDQADVDAAADVQKQLIANATAGSTAPASLSTAVPANTDWEAFFAYADQLMVENPVAAGSAADALKALGLGGGTFSAAALSSTQKTDLEAGASAAYQRATAAAQGGTVAQGWVYPQSDLGDFGADFAYRARVAIGGLGALPVQEALYINGAGDAATPQRYDGSTHSYSLTFPAGMLPPNGAFWSLTLYEPDADGSLFFYDNPQNRYAIGSGSSGLAYASDGSLTLQIQHDDPASGAVDLNWLPAPAGPFALILRVYLPGSGLVDGSYRVPALVAQ